MATRNDITGDLIATRQITDTYRNNYDLIFGKKKKQNDDAITTDDPTGQPEPTNPDPKP
jgi:hypothetical protein